MQYIIDILKTYIKYILLHRWNKIDVWRLELLESYWGNRPTKGARRWLYDKVREKNGLSPMSVESKLILLAEMHPDDKVANAAMKELREKFDTTYFWCEDCDGLVCKEKDCCLNNLNDNWTLLFN